MMMVADGCWYGETVGCAPDQDDVIDHDKTHDEAMTEDDDEPQDTPG